MRGSYRIDGAPDTIRTCGLYLRRVALYPGATGACAAYAVLTRILDDCEEICVDLLSPSNYVAFFVFLSRKTT
jgi:hypothetical protein